MEDAVGVARGEEGPRRTEDGREEVERQGGEQDPGRAQIGDALDERRAHRLSLGRDAGRRPQHPHRDERRPNEAESTQYAPASPRRAMTTPASAEPNTSANWKAVWFRGHRGADKPPLATSR